MLEHREAEHGPHQIDEDMHHDKADKEAQKEAQHVDGHAEDGLVDIIAYVAGQIAQRAEDLRRQVVLQQGADGVGQIGLLHHLRNRVPGQPADRLTAQIQIAQQALGVGIGGEHAGDVGIGRDYVRQPGIKQKGTHDGQKASAKAQHRLDKTPVQAEKHADQNDGKGREINGIQASFLL